MTIADAAEAGELFAASVYSLISIRIKVCVYGVREFTFSLPAGTMTGTPCMLALFTALLKAAENGPPRGRHITAWPTLPLVSMSLIVHWIPAIIAAMVPLPLSFRTLTEMMLTCFATPEMVPAMTPATAVPEPFPCA